MGWNAEEKASYFLNALEDMKAMLTDFDNAEDWEHAKTTARCLAWLSGNENWFEVSHEYWKKQQQKLAKGEPIDIRALLPLLKKGWVARNKDGRWFWYEYKPFKGKDFWSSDGSSKMAFIGGFNIKPAENWETSLMECGL